MFFWKAVAKANTLVDHCKSLWWLAKLKALESASHSLLEVGAENFFQVPVRSGGRGSLVIGRGNHFGYKLAPKLGNGEVMLQPRNLKAKISIGDDNDFSNNVCIVAKGEIRIADQCLIGDQVMIVDSDFHDLHPSRRRSNAGLVAPVHIESNVWLGSRVVVLKGVTIGRNSVIGAMSLVTRPIPANCVAAGVPAKVIKQLE